MLFDIGGGNGFVAAAFQAAGYPVVLIEPGEDGVRHAQARGVRHIVHATFNESSFRPDSLPAACFFDVLEHIEDEQGFLGGLHRCLIPSGRIYLTVPAGRWLWSDDDVQAGHFRRYTRRTLASSLAQSGFKALFISKLFSVLPLPLFLCRAVPSLGGRLLLPRNGYSGLHRPRARGLLDRVWDWEQSRIKRGKAIIWGTSCVAVAEKISCTPGW